MTARPAKERMPVTIHYETVEALVVGAEYQDNIADAARIDAAEMAKEVEALTNRLNDLRPRLAAAEKAAMDAERLAADFRVMAAEYCEHNGWTMPEPKTAEPGETQPDGAEIQAALAEEDGKENG